MFYGYRKVPCWYQGSPRPPRGRRDRGVVFILLMIKAGLGTTKLDFQPRTAGQSRPKPPPRQRTAGQAQAWQGREGLDCCSICACLSHLLPGPASEPRKHPTSNAQHPIMAQTRVLGCSMFDVGFQGNSLPPCSPAFRVLAFPRSPIHIQTVREFGATMAGRYQR